ncbi:MAG: MFS transporter [Polyangiaceae bacterium]|nr:MFS transporter [Polyangiaceae bacterium]
MLLSGGRLWGAVAGLSVDQLVAWGILYYAYTVLSAPVALDLGVSRLQMAAAFSGCLLVAGWVGQFLGPFLDVYGTRYALRAGAIVAPLAFAAVALVDGMVSLVVAFALLGVAQALSLYEPAFRAIVDWCPDERERSRATLGLTLVGGFASAVFLPFTSWLLAHHGWRQVVLVLAGVLTLVLVPTRLLLPLTSRGHVQHRTSHAPVAPSVRRLAAGLALQSLASTGVFLYLMWQLVEQGEPVVAAAAVAGLAGAAQVPGRLLYGPLRRFVGGESLLPLLLGVQAAALLGIALTRGALALACILLFGAANGMMTLERATVLVGWYGRATFGAHQGHLVAATGMARALSPFVVELGHAVVSYAVVFGLLGAVLTLGAWACSSAASLRAQDAG